MAHIWHYAFPVARRLSSHACRANDIAAQTAEFFPEESGARCATELLFDPKPKGEPVEERRGEACEPGVLIEQQRSLCSNDFCGQCKCLKRESVAPLLILSALRSNYLCSCYSREYMGVGLSVQRAYVVAF